MSETKAPASQEKLVESYMKWTVDARGLNIMSAKQRASLSRRLLAFLRSRGRTLAKATPVDIDAFISENAHCWKRVTRRTIASRLRDFLGYAAKRKLCAQRLRMSISTPRVYPLEGLPYHAPWEKVVEMLRMAAKDTSRRGRMSYAILMVLATYSVRASEVVRLKLKTSTGDGRRFTSVVPRTDVRTRCILPRQLVTRSFGTSARRGTMKASRRICFSGRTSLMPPSQDISSSTWPRRHYGGWEWRPCISARTASGTASPPIS